MNIAKTAQDVILSSEKGKVPITIAKTNDEGLTIYKDTTWVSSHLVSDRLRQEVNQKRTKYYKEIDPKYDMENVKKKISNDKNNKCRADFHNLGDDFSDVFSINQRDFRKCDATCYRIDMKPESQSMKLPNRRMPVDFKDDLKQNIDAFVTKVLITPCHSPCSAPGVPVPKNNGKLPLVIDSRKTDGETIKSCWPIPTIEEVFDTLQRSAYFTTIDMSWGFYQLPREPTNQSYTAFPTQHFGTFKRLRMPKRLTGRPNTFQGLMEHLFVGLIWSIPVPFLNDCIIFSKTPKEHIKRLQQTFERIREVKMKINRKECPFFQQKVQFL